MDGWMGWMDGWMDGWWVVQPATLKNAFCGAGQRAGRKRNAYRILVGKPQGKRPVGRPRRNWVNNIKLCIREI
jgi:hypothetical protein